jgi:hypothetical protein
MQDIEHRKIPDPSPIAPANEWNALQEVLAAYDARYDGKRLDTKRIGNALRIIEGRVLGGARLVRKGVSHSAALWKREDLK